MTKTFSKKDLELLEDTLHDLNYLDQTWRSEDLTPSETKRISVTLRRFLLDYEIIRAAKLLKLSIAISSHLELPSRKVLNQELIYFAFVSWAKIWAVDIGFFNSAYSGGKQFDYDNDKLIPLRFGNFLKQKTLFYHGTFISREDLLRYAANIMGGAHHGKINKEKQKIIEKSRGAVVYKPDRENNTIKMNVEVNQLMNLNDETYFQEGVFDIVHVELLATARQVSNSPDVLKLKEKIKEVF